jgi:hypothetical protein
MRIKEIIKITEEHITTEEECHNQYVRKDNGKWFRVFSGFNYPVANSEQLENAYIQYVYPDTPMPDHE